MRRLVFGVLVLSLAALTFFAGCQRNTVPAVQVATGSKGRQDPFAKYDPMITMTSVRTMSPNDKFDQTDPDKRSYEENRWNRTFKEDLGVILKYDWIAPDADSNTAKWIAAIAARQVPDFANVSDNIYKQLYDADLIADLTDIWGDYVTPEYEEALGENDVAMLKQDGRMYGFPVSMRAMNGGSLLFMRQDWLDRLNLQKPETIDEALEIARKFRDAKLGGTDTIPFMFSNNMSGGLNFNGADGKWDGFFNGYGAYLNYWLEKDGKLVYSNVQPEFRPALLKAQEIYKEGLINKDFAALSDTVAREYIASGKAGMYYSAAWMVTQGMNTLVTNSPYKTTPEKMIAFVFPVPPVKGQVVKAQTNTPKAWRIFVSSLSAHPEAAVKIGIMAYHYAQIREDRAYYSSPDDWPMYKYIPWGDTMTPVYQDLLRGHAVRAAVENGDMSILEANNWSAALESWNLAREGTGSVPYQMMMNGPNGTFSLLYDYYNKGQLLMDAFSTLPTDTMTLKGDILRGQLEAAMYEVIMGANISVWDQAVSKWYTDGGNQILTEVNKWYDGTKKK